MPLTEHYPEKRMLTIITLKPLKSSYHEKDDSVNRNFIFTGILSLLRPWHNHRTGSQWQGPLWQKLPALIPAVNNSTYQKSNVPINQ